MRARYRHVKPRATRRHDNHLVRIEQRSEQAPCVSLIGVNYYCRSRCLKEYVTEAELLPHADVTELRSLPHDCVTQIMEAWICVNRQGL